MRLVRLSVLQPSSLACFHLSTTSHTVSSCFLLPSRLFDSPSWKCLDKPQTSIFSTAWIALPRSSTSSHTTVAPLLTLPNLETLVLDEFDQPEERLFVQDNFEQGASYDGTKDFCVKHDFHLQAAIPNDTKSDTSPNDLEFEKQQGLASTHDNLISNFKKLVIYWGSWHPGTMGKIPQRLPSLRTLIWEDHMPVHRTDYTDGHVSVYVHRTGSSTLVAFANSLLSLMLTSLSTLP